MRSKGVGHQQHDTMHTGTPRLDGADMTELSHDGASARELTATGSSSPASAGTHRPARENSRWRVSFADFPADAATSIAVGSIALNLVLTALLAHAHISLVELAANPGVLPIPVMLYDGATPSYRIPAFSGALERHQAMAMSEATSLLIDATRIEGLTQSEHYKRIGPEGPVRCRMTKEVYDQWFPQAQALAERTFKTSPKIFRHVRNARPVDWTPLGEHSGQVAVEMDIVPVEGNGKERPPILVRTLVTYEYRDQTTANPLTALCNPSGFFVTSQFEEIAR